MTKLLTLLLSLLLLLPTLSSCQKHKADARPMVAVSIEPLRYVVEAVAGEKFQVVTLMPQGASPETYEPTPRQMTSLSDCALVMRCGTLGFEQTQLPQMVKTTQATKLISLSTGITPIEEEEHAHGHSSSQKSPTSEATNTNKEEANHNSKALSHSIDPHLWMSARNLSQMAANAAQALCEADPKNADYYLQRLQQFQQKMTALDAELKQSFSSAKQKTFLIYHPALGYLAQQYGLKQLPVEHDGKDPSAAYMQQLIAQCKSQGVKVAFISKEHTGKAAQRIAHEAKMRVVSINPLAYDVAEQMRHIAQELNK